MTSTLWPLVQRIQADEYRDERDLILAAQREPAALGELYRQHYPAVARYVHRRVGDQHEAEDVISEVFLLMVQHLRRYRCRGVPFRVWLFRLATSQLSRWARRRRRWAVRQLQQHVPATDSSHRVDLEMVDLVLSTLPQRLQSVLWLHYLAEMKVADVAGVLGCSPGTVKSRLSEGRALMRRRLEKRGFEK